MNLENIVAEVVAKEMAKERALLFKNIEIKEMDPHEKVELTVTNEKVPKDLEATIKLQDDSEKRLGKHKIITL